jgi:hypothetical protein
MDGDPDALSALQNDLGATAENIEADARRLAAIEAEKTSLQPDDPRLEELAREGELVAARMAATTKLESALIAEASEKRDQPG